VARTPSFLEFLYGGCEVSIIFGIDYTGSNGNPTLRNSLHYIDEEGVPNEYMQAIMTVGNIVAPYDYDKRFPAYGFGAKVNDGAVSHCFHLNFNPANPECDGIEGILNAYRHSMKTIELWGPTNFAPIIRQVIAIAQPFCRPPAGAPQKYFVLLILTDGAITDVDDTVNAIIEASNYPVSIIIIGVGNHNFVEMNLLDSDNELLHIGKNYASRDIVQFVPFRSYYDKGNFAGLAKDTLKEVPDQLVKYFFSNRIAPNPSKY